MNFPSSFNLSDLDGTNGFTINGIDSRNYSGSSVSGAGDVNGDGIDDIIIDVTGASPDGYSYPVESYVVFGSNGGFSDSLNLADLDGSNGFVINGIDAAERSGGSVSGAGDVNGDGIADIIIGARSANPNGKLAGMFAGESYVVFGNSNGFSDSFDLANLDGSNGFVINGIDADDRSGGSVSGAGDVNGDGIADIIIGARYADPNGNARAGESYVVFGSSSGFSDSFNLADLNGGNGFVINGINTYDFSGGSVSGAGDVNGDGIADIIIGASFADPNGNDRTDRAGESYVVFGSSNGFSDSFNLAELDGSNGFVIKGINSLDFSGGSVSSAGDVNGDGIGDLIIGASSASPNGNELAGESYVVFGNSDGFSDSFNLADLDGTNGFVINGINSLDFSGGSVSGAGDINGDGIADIIIGVTGASPNGYSYAGESYVVFGSNGGFSGSLNLADLDGSNGFVINGIDAADRSGDPVSGAGDVNGDGIADIIIGARNADPNGSENAGESYVVFGVASNTEPDLTPQGSAVYRFLNQDTGVHFYTSSEGERQLLEDSLPNYIFEGEAFVSVDSLTGSPQPQEVFRFLNQDTGTYLYTISGDEKEFVEDNLPHFNLETESFWGYSQAQVGTIPVYRFFNTQTGAHFYTPSETEREFIVDNLPNYQVEGIAYHMFPV